MSGHSKWSTIKRKKEKTDSQKAKIFTKMAREITVIVKESGADPTSNTRLREVIAKARSLNVPSDNIERLIKKAEGGERDSYEEVLYEGYGVSGVAVLVKSLTDNRNRTASNIRHYFDKYGAGLGTTGCVAFSFNQKGIIELAATSNSEEQITEHCIEAGAEDFEQGEDYLVVYTDLPQLHTAAEMLEKQGYTLISAENGYIPTSTVSITDPQQIKKMSLLIESLQEDDDVQDYYTNLENEI